MIRLRMGKFCGGGGVPTGNSVISAPPRATICSVSRVFSFGYFVNSGTEDGDRIPLGGDGSAMRRNIDATSQAADDHQAARGQVGG